MSVVINDVEVTPQGSASQASVPDSEPAPSRAGTPAEAVASVLRDGNLRSSRLAAD
jgi:hypothetical protein